MVHDTRTNDVEMCRILWSTMYDLVWSLVDAMFFLKNTVEFFLRDSSTPQ